MAFDERPDARGAGERAGALERAALAVLVTARDLADVAHALEVLEHGLYHLGGGVQGVGEVGE